MLDKVKFRKRRTIRLGLLTKEIISAEVASEANWPESITNTMLIGEIFIC